MKTRLSKIASNTFCNKPLMLYSACSIALLGLFAAMLAWSNTAPIWNADGLAQWYANFFKLKETLLELAQGKYAFWSWDVGLGQDTTAYLATFLFNPITWICVFFNEGNMDVCFTICVLVQFYLTGLTMCIYLRHLKLESWLCALGGLGYLFCIQTLHSIDEFIFMFPAILFPLIILGIDFIYEKKNPLVLIISGAVLALNYLYMTYMVVVMGFIYLGLKTAFTAKQQGIKAALQRLAATIGYAALACAIALPLLLPSVYALLTNSKASGSSPQLLPTIPDFLTFLASLFSPQLSTESTDRAYIGMLGIFGLLLPFTIRRAKKRCAHSIMAVIALLFAFIPATRFLMNGGSYATGRWNFMLVFFCIAATCLVIQHEKVDTEKDTKTVYAFAAIVVALEFISTIFVEQTTSAQLLYALVNIALGILTYWLITHKKRAVAAMKTSMAAVLVLLLMLWAPNGVSYISSFIPFGKAEQTYENAAYSASTKLANSEFYRSSNPIISHESKANQGVYYGIPTVESFTSFLDARLIKFNTSLSVNLSASHRCNYLGNDNRPGLDYLLGVKKAYLEEDSSYTTTNEYAKALANAGSYFEKTSNKYVLQSKYEPSLGYVFKNSISESDYETLSEVEKEQALLQAVVTSDNANAANTQTSNLSFSSKTLSAKVTDENGNEVANGTFEKNLKGTQKLTVSFDGAQKDCDLYVKLTNFHLTQYSPESEYEAKNSGKQAAGFDATNLLLANTIRSTTREYFDVTAKYGNCEKVIHSLKNNQSLAPLGDYITYLGNYDNNTKKLTLSFTNVGTYTWDSIEVVQVPKGALNESMSAMEQNALNVTKVTKNRVYGTVNTETDGTLFLSIINNPGWKVYIDGKETPTYCVDTAFTGCDISAGEHSVELVYKPIFFMQALVVSGAGLLALVAVLVLRRTVFRNNKECSTAR
jgi:uncharacterized membrane protein YfhO